MLGTAMLVRQHSAALCCPTPYLFAHPTNPAGMQYLDWLADARRALVLGTENFIARDAANLAEFLDLRRLLPLLGKLNLAELLGSHHSRFDFMSHGNNLRSAGLLPLCG